MSLTRFPNRQLDLGHSRYPAIMAAITAIVMAVILLLAGVNAVFALPLAALAGWKTLSTVSYAVHLQLVENVITVIDHNGKVLTLPARFRVVRCGPWLALGHGLRWCHIFSDQADQDELHPFMQWLWLTRQ